MSTPCLVLYDFEKGKERSEEAKTCSICGEYVNIFAYDQRAADDVQICVECQRNLGA